VETLEALDKHEDEIRLCLAKQYWCDVSEADNVVKELQNKARGLRASLSRAEEEVNEAISKKESIGTVESVSQVLETSHPIRDTSPHCPALHC
jgi:hypothetical protein